MAVNVRQIVEWIEELAPPFLAEDWDNVGLQVGDPDSCAARVLTALTVTSEVVDQAVEGGFDLIAVHHPVLFRPVARLVTDHPVGSLLYKMVRSGVACVAAHTNLDAALGGVNDGLAGRLGLDQLSVLSPAASGTMSKLVTFVPADHVDAVREAIAASGAAEIGAYTHCTFGATGVGTFVPGSNADPHIGRAGRLNRVEEVRLEAVLPGRVRERALKLLRDAHPYEEVPIDIYPLEGSVDPRVGIGRIGQLPAPMAVEDFLEHIKKSLRLNNLRTAGVRPEEIETVAVVGGSGGSFVRQARERGADALITGDVDYHDADLARSVGLFVVDAGHFGTEKHVPVDLAEYLTRRAKRDGEAIEVAVAHEVDAFLM